MADELYKMLDLFQHRFLKIPVLLIFLIGTAEPKVNASAFMLDILTTLNYVQELLMHIGPVLSAVLFIIAGILYAIGQLFPTYKRASYHSAAIDIIIGAIIVAVLSVASTGLAVASTHLLSNTSVIANAL